MNRIKDKQMIEVNDKFWSINTKKSGLLNHAIHSIITQFDNMLSHHSKLFVLRIDLRMHDYTAKNNCITIFNRQLHKWLKRKYSLKRVGFCWCREQVSAEKQHYHYVLIIDGHKANYPNQINTKAKEIWERVFGSIFFPKNGFYNVKRNNERSIQDAIYRMSYLAKCKGKGNRPPQTKDFGSSRIKCK